VNFRPRLSVSAVLGYNVAFEPLVPNAVTIEAMKEARRGGLKSFATVEDLMADLNAVD
jgi:antitoxin component of RelBE/YafQ-DinJ toxin-antitoxin module